MTNAERQARWRQRQRATNGKRQLEPCGTLAAHRRHQRNGERPCDACRDIYNTNARRLYAARKGK